MVDFACHIDSMTDGLLTCLGDDAIIRVGDAQYCVRGLFKNSESFVAGSDGSKPTPTLRVKTSDVSVLELTSGSSVTIGGNTYSIASRQPDVKSGMTLINLRRTG
ncbi:MAG: hypothetical protein WBO93_08880 [Gammaproteobacteria bacterium]